MYFYFGLVSPFGLTYSTISKTIYTYLFLLVLLNLSEKQVYKFEQAYIFFVVIMSI